MDKIYDQLLDCALYLYPNERNARTGIQSGGSGFLVRVMSEVHGNELWHYFAVTAGHVVNDGACVIRLNTYDGYHDTIPLEKHDWILSVQDDLAIAFVQPDERFKYEAIASDFFLAKEDVGKWIMLGPGDEAVVVGRFVNHEGKQKNLPCVRCGNIAMMADENEKVLISRSPERFQEAFLVELHTKCGYSGSPVFLHAANRRGPDGFKILHYAPRDPYGPKLLGVHIGQIQDTIDRKVQTDLIDTGMAIVIPAWRLNLLLKSAKATAMKKTADEEFAASKARPPVKLESAGQEDSGGDPL